MRTAVVGLGGTFKTIAARQACCNTGLRACCRLLGGMRDVCEFRNYDPYLIAEVTMEDVTMREARKKGFWSVRCPSAICFCVDMPNKVNTARMRILLISCLNASLARAHNMRAELDMVAHRAIHPAASSPVPKSRSAVLVRQLIMCR